MSLESDSEWIKETEIFLFLLLLNKICSSKYWICNVSFLPSVPRSKFEFWGHATCFLDQEILYRLFVISSSASCWITVDCFCSYPQSHSLILLSNNLDAYCSAIVSLLWKVRMNRAEWLCIKVEFCWSFVLLREEEKGKLRKAQQRRWWEKYFPLPCLFSSKAEL